MALLALVQQGSRLGVVGGALQVQRGGAVVETLQPHQVDEVHLYGGVSLSTAARNLLLREGIDVVFLTRDGRYRGRLVGAESRQGRRRLQQYAAVHDEARRLAIARAVVAGKVANQRRLLLRRQESLRSEGLADVLVALRGLGARAAEAPGLEQLRGLEGLAARRYFEGFREALRNPAFTFDGRNRHPPRDPVNACLSFGYTLLLVRVEDAVRAAGLDPFLGFLHDAGRGAPSLALDLMEELRPAVDGVVLNLLNRRQLGPEDFRQPPAEELGARAELADGAVYLGDVGRTILIRAWERRLDRRDPHPAREERWTLRELLREQARQLARVVEGEAQVYQAVELRG